MTRAQANRWVAPIVFLVAVVLFALAMVTIGDVVDTAYDTGYQDALAGRAHQ